MDKIIIPKFIFDGQDLLEQHALVINSVNQNVKLIPQADINQYPQAILNYYNDGLITPGFIDLQLNGCGGVSFNEDLALSTLNTMYLTCLKYATTKFLPTLITTNWDQVISALAIVKQWMAMYAYSKGVIGIHLEGPFISKIKKGIHPEDLIIPPQDSLLQQIVAYRQYFPIKMTIAPEVFTHAQISYLIDNNIILAIGHTGASFKVANAALNLGITCATHTFNAMSGLSARDPGVIAALLNSSGVYLGLIADLYHVDPANIQLLHKLKNNYMYLVTDTVTAMDTNIKNFRFAATDIYAQDGKFLDINGTLAGANLNLIQALKNCLDIGLPLGDVLKMLTSVPALALGIAELYPKLSALNDLMYLDLNNWSCQKVLALL